MRPHLPAGEIPQRRADRDGQIKDREDAIAVALRIEIGQNGWSEDAKGGLANAHQSLAGVEGPVPVHPDRGQRGQTPQHRAGNNHRLARKAIAKPAGQRRGNHIKKKQRRRQRAHLVVGGVEVALDKRELAGKDVAVNVIQ